MWHFSDSHNGDRDQDAELMWEFRHQVFSLRQTVMCHGDWITCSRYLATITRDPLTWPETWGNSIQRGWRGNLLIQSGNHDRTIRCPSLGYQVPDVYPVCTPGLPRRVYLHGHQFQHFWDPESGHGWARNARLWLGEEIIERAYQAEWSIHPRIDDAILGGLGRAARLFLPDGASMGVEAFQAAQSRYGRENGFDEVICGHLHEMYDVMIGKVRCVCLGACVPRMTTSGDGIQKAGEVWMGVFEDDDGVLYRFTMDGMRPFKEYQEVSL